MRRTGYDERAARWACMVGGCVDPIVLFHSLDGTIEGVDDLLNDRVYCNDWYRNRQMNTV